MTLKSSGPTARGSYLTLIATFVDGYPGVERKYVFHNVEKRSKIMVSVNKLENMYCL